MLQAWNRLSKSKKKNAQNSAIYAFLITLIFVLSGLEGLASLLLTLCIVITFTGIALGAPKALSRRYDFSQHLRCKDPAHPTLWNISFTATGTVLFLAWIAVSLLLSLAIWMILADCLPFITMNPDNWFYGVCDYPL